MPPRLLPFTALLPVLCLSGSAFALDEFRFRSDMFDFDQMRNGLPADKGVPGAMYCVPTSFTNNLAYLHANGMPSMLNGANPNSHQEMTNLIFLLGVFMSTDAHTGTRGSFNTESSWVDEHTSKLVCFGSWGPSSTWSYKTIMNQFRSGSLVRMGYGRYANVNGTWFRVGGHSVTMAGHGRFDSGSQQDYFLVTDPASDDDNYGAQGQFWYEQKETSTITLNTSDYGPVTHARYTNWDGPNGNNRAMVDGMTTIKPAYAGWTAPNLDGTNFRIHFQYMPGDTAEFPMDYSFNAVGDVRDWCFDPMEFGVCWVDSSGGVHKHDVATGDETLLFTSASVRQVAIGGPNQDVYLLRTSLAFDNVTRIRRDGGATVTKALPGHALAIDVDEVTGGVVALNSNGSSTTAFDADFTTSRQETFRSLSLADPILLGGGATLFSVDSDTGDYLVAVEGGQSWTRYRKHGSLRFGVRVNVSLPGGLMAMTPGPQRTVFLQDDNRTLHVYDSSGNIRPTEFSGYQPGGAFQLVKSFRAYRPGEMLGPGWDNVLPIGDEP